MGDTPVHEGDFFVGYRTWVVKDDGRLLSTNQHYEWPTGDIQAECNPPGSGGGNIRLRDDKHMVPAEDCDCGIYAYYDVKADRVRFGEVLGVILVWGDIMLHNERMRAQFARVGAILVPTAFTRPDPDATDDESELMRQEWKRIDAACERYDIPVLQVDQPEDAERIVQAEFGRHVTPEELPSGNDKARRELAGEGGSNE